MDGADTALIALTVLYDQSHIARFDMPVPSQRFVVLFHEPRGIPPSYYIQDNLWSFASPRQVDH